jgi:predicted nuclease with TOPRIM domain
MPNETSAAPNAAAPAGQQGDARPPSPRNNAQARIDEITKEKAEFQRRAEKYGNELRGLRDELAELKGQLAAQPAVPQAPKTARSWQEATDEQLESGRSYAREHENADMLDAIRDEQMSRVAKKAKHEAVEEAKKATDEKFLLREIHQRILDDFGPEALTDRESPLFQAADRYLQDQRRLYGDDVARRPHALYDAFAHAERNTKVRGERERLKELEQENLRLKEAVSLAERGGVAPSNARPLSDEVKERIKAGDQKGATRKLATVQALARAVKANMLPKQ